MSPMQDKIKHVVVLMLENRSLDSVLGWLYEKSSPEHFVPENRREPYNGLQNIALNDFVNELRTSDGKLLFSSPPIKGPSELSVPDPDPYEEYAHVTMQLFGSTEPPVEGTVATMKGFLQDYAGQWRESSWDSSRDQIRQVMQTFTPDQLPVLNGLAQFYAASDEWFASVPTQTNANRAFSLTGTSLGLVDNDYLSAVRGLADDRFRTDTIWNRLSDFGHNDWTIFWDSLFPPLISSTSYTRRIFPHLETIPNIDAHFQHTAVFHQLARAGKLPAFSYLEPKWTLMVDGIGWQGTDYHPPGDQQEGEDFVRSVYESLVANEQAWNGTLLVVLFDESVGSFDHVSPPWKVKAPWGDGPCPYDPPPQYGFDFKRLGGRVPALLISPWINKGTVFRTEDRTSHFDHTSLIATILTWAGVPKDQWKLGARVDVAPTFDHVLTRTEPRNDRLVFPKRGSTTTSLVCYFTNGKDTTWHWGLNNDDSYFKINGDWLTTQYTKLTKFVATTNREEMQLAAANAKRYYELEGYSLLAIFASDSSAGSNYPIVVNGWELYPRC